MTTDYEEPNSGLSGYGSMSNRSHIYKASQIRGTPHYARPRSIRRLGSTSTRGGGVIIYFAFTIVICAFNLAATCYLIVTSEVRPPNCGSGSKESKTSETMSFSDQLDQMSSSINTMMTALTYTLPQVLNTNKLSLQNRLNHLATELRDLIRMNSLELDVKLALNRSIQLRSGSRNSHITNWTKTPVRVSPTSTAPHKMVTLVPRRVPTQGRNLPFTKLYDPDDPRGHRKDGVTSRSYDNEQDVTRREDYENLTPVF
ncbi:transmembrane protein [Wufeng Apodemus chevrieri jeilongvirus 1]|uniref:Transmembrane protein n=1 Tax=Wufeng Apodemus chevrieri jeilongvirus 1 TaxID=2928987 RepID=A0A8T9KLF6_9MONO|nr:transmembrane protein [Wufeng Apodemus chevrieri jeilongvirus 1]